MFDFSRLSELTAAAASSFMIGGEEPTRQFAEILQNAGLDPSILAGLPESEIAALLADHGIDVAPFLEAGLPNGLTGFSFSDGINNG